MANQPSRGIADFKSYRTGWSAAEPIVDDRALGRIFANRRFRSKGRIVIVVRADVYSWRRREEVGWLDLFATLQLSKKREVTQNPDSSPLRRHDEIVTMDKKVPCPSCWQVFAKAFPIIAVIEANEHASLISRVNEARANGIRTYRTDDLPLRKAMADVRPGLPSIMGSEHVRPPVVDPLSIDRCVSGTRV